MGVEVEEDNQTQIQNPEPMDASYRDSIAENPNSPASSDSPDDSDADSEDESHQSDELKTLEAELSNNPSNYYAHVQVSYFSLWL